MRGERADELLFMVADCVIFQNVIYRVVRSDKARSFYVAFYDC